MPSTKNKPEEGSDKVQPAQEAGQTEWHEGHHYALQIIGDDFTGRIFEQLDRRKPLKTKKKPPVSNDRES